MYIFFSVLPLIFLGFACYLFFLIRLTDFSLITVGLFPLFFSCSETSQSFFLGNLNKRAKVVTLHIKGLANQV